MITITKLGIHALLHLAKGFKADPEYKGFKIPFQETFQSTKPPESEEENEKQYYHFSYRIFFWDWEYGLYEVLISSEADALPLWRRIREILVHDNCISDKRVIKRISHIAILIHEHQEPFGAYYARRLNIYRFKEEIFNEFIESLKIKI